jgi:DNA-binding transcriptional LysR family regulator
MRTDDILANRDHLAFADTLDHDHIGLHQASSIYTRSLIEARLAGRSLRLRIHVPGFDAVCRMTQAGMGVGIIPQHAYELLGRSMGLIAKPLTDPWAARALQIILRHHPLSGVGTLLVDHLRSGAERSS